MRLIVLIIATLFFSTASIAEIDCDKHAVASSASYLLKVTALKLDQLKSYSIGSSGQSDQYYISYRVDFKTTLDRKLQVISMFNNSCELEEIVCFEKTDFCKP